MPDRIPEYMPDKMPEYLPHRIVEYMPDLMPEGRSDRKPVFMPERMPDMSNRWPEYMPDRLSEYMPERLSEYIMSNGMVEGSLESKLPTIWTDEKAQPGRNRGTWRNSDVEKVRMEKIKDGESQKREDDAGARKGRRSRETPVFFRMFVAPEGRKVGSLKRRVRSQLAR